VDVFLLLVARRLDLEDDHQTWYAHPIGLPSTISPNAAIAAEVGLVGKSDSQRVALCNDMAFTAHGCEGGNDLWQLHHRQAAIVSKEEGSDMTSIVDELNALMAQLPPKEQERVLDFARELAHPPIFPHTPLPAAKPHDLLLTLRVPPEVADAMEAAHEECERIDEDE
jgi:hypothetical protein